MQLWRSLLSLLGLLVAATILSAPATASRLHLASHASMPVLSGEHHHHDGDTVEVHPSESDSGSKTATDKAGHTHVGYSIADLAANPGKVGDPVYANETSGTFAADTPALNTLGWAPQIRPPRAA